MQAAEHAGGAPSRAIIFVDSHMWPQWGCIGVQWWIDRQASAAIRPVSRSICETATVLAVCLGAWDGAEATVSRDMHAITSAL